MARRKRPSDDFINLIVESGSSDKAIALDAQREIAKAVEVPLREGLMAGDITNGIFDIDESGSTELPLDLVAPGTEGQYVAYTNPGHGRIPERSIESDYVTIPTYGISSSIDFLLKYADEANWNVVARAMEVLQAGFVKKINDDAWKTLLAAAVDRNVLVYDADAAAGQFTKRLISLMKTIVMRNGGGNSVTANGRLTDAFLAPEGIEDVRNWGVDQLDELSRREVYLAADNGGAISRIYGINLHGLFEFGDQQEYQEYFTDDLGGSLGASDTELIIGLDLSSSDSFVMPVKKPVEIFEDEAMHRLQRQGYYGWSTLGFGVLDSRRLIAASF